MVNKTLKEMKIILTFFYKNCLLGILILITGNSFSQNWDIDLANSLPLYDLNKIEINNYIKNGHVKSFNSLIYSAVEKFGEVDKGELIEVAFENNFKVEFSKSGKLTSYSIFNKEGATIRKTIYTYDDLININLVRTVNSNGETVHLEKWNFKENLPISQIIEHIGGPKLELKFSYTNDSRLSKINNDSYNYAGNKLNISYTDNRGQVESKKNLVFQGNKVIQISELNNQNIILKKIEYKYDTKGNILSKTISENGKISSKNSMSYNSYGDLIKKVSELYEITYKYEYNHNNNWIKKIKFFNGIPEYVRVRSIQYY